MEWKTTWAMFNGQIFDYTSVENFIVNGKEMSIQAHGLSWNLELKMFYSTEA